MCSESSCGDGICNLENDTCECKPGWIGNTDLTLGSPTCSVHRLLLQVLWGIEAFIQFFIVMPISIYAAKYCYRKISQDNSFWICILATATGLFLGLTGVLRLVYPSRTIGNDEIVTTFSFLGYVLLSSYAHLFITRFLDINITKLQLELVMKNRIKHIRATLPTTILVISLVGGVNFMCMLGTTDVYFRTIMQQVYFVGNSILAGALYLQIVYFGFNPLLAAIKPNTAELRATILKIKYVRLFFIFQGIILQPIGFIVGFMPKIRDAAGGYYLAVVFSSSAFVIVPIIIIMMSNSNSSSQRENATGPRGTAFDHDRSVAFIIRDKDHKFIPGTEEMVNRIEEFLPNHDDPLSPTIISRSILVLHENNRRIDFQKLFLVVPQTIQILTAGICIAGLVLQVMVSTLSEPAEFLSYALLIPICWILMMLIFASEYHILAKVIIDPLFWAQICNLGALLISGIISFPNEKCLVVIMIFVLRVASISVDAIFRLGIICRRVLIICSFISIVIELVLIFMNTPQKSLAYLILPIFKKQSSISVYGIFRDMLIITGLSAVKDVIIGIRGKDKKRLIKVFDDVHVEYETIEKEEEERKRWEEIQQTIENARLNRFDRGKVFKGNQYASFVGLKSGFLVEGYDNSQVSPAGFANAEPATPVVQAYCDRIFIRERTLIALIIFGEERGRRILRYTSSITHKILAVWTPMIIMAIVVISELTNNGTYRLAYLAILSIISPIFSLITLSLPMCKILVRRQEFLGNVFMLVIWCVSTSILFGDERIIVCLGFVAIWTRGFLDDARFVYSPEKISILKSARYALILLYTLSMSMVFQLGLLSGKIHLNTNPSNKITQETDNLTSTSIHGLYYSPNSSLAESFFDQDQFAASFGISMTLRFTALTILGLRARYYGFFRDIKRPICIEFASQ